MTIILKGLAHARCVPQLPDTALALVITVELCPPGSPSATTPLALLLAPKPLTALSLGLLAWAHGRALELMLG